MPMQKFTHFDLLEITEKEGELKTLLTQQKEQKMYSPKKETINNILGYSKALSIRKSDNLEFIELVLN
jgi:hypothetical protein